MAPSNNATEAVRSTNTDHVIGRAGQVLLSSQPRNNFVPVITTGTAKSELQRLLEGESRTKAREPYNASTLLEERVTGSVGGRFLSRVGFVLIGIDDQQNMMRGNVRYSFPLLSAVICIPPATNMELICREPCFNMFGDEFEHGDWKTAGSVVQ